MTDYLNPRIIKVRIRNVYGLKTIYPLCDDAKTFAAMLGQKTLTITNISYIQSLNYEVHDIPEPATTFKL